MQVLPARCGGPLRPSCCQVCTASWSQLVPPAIREHLCTRLEHNAAACSPLTYHARHPNSTPGASAPTPTPFHGMQVPQRPPTCPARTSQIPPSLPRFPSCIHLRTHTHSTPTQLGGRCIYPPQLHRPHLVSQCAVVRVSSRPTRSRIKHATLPPPARVSTKCSTLPFLRARSALAPTPAYYTISTNRYARCASSLPLSYPPRFQRWPLDSVHDVAAPARRCTSLDCINATVPTNINDRRVALTSTRPPIKPTHPCFRACLAPPVILLCPRCCYAYAPLARQPT